jgi:hypothetical protein
MLQSSSQLSLLSEVRCSHLPPISRAGQAIGPSGERVGERDGILDRVLWNRHGPPEDTFLGDTDPRSGPTQEKSRALWDAEQGTCQRRGSNLSPRNGFPPECATGQKEDGPVDQLAGLIGAGRFFKKNPPGVTGR